MVRLRRCTATAPQDNGTDGNSGKGGSMGSLVAIGASVSTSVRRLKLMTLGARRASKLLKCPLFFSFLSAL
jgi:hypothetical protein